MNEIEKARYAEKQCIKCGGQDSFTLRGRKCCKACTYEKLQPKTMCWECNNAVPNRERTVGCEWSVRKKPVPNWVAEKSTIYPNGYCVLRCPKFTPYIRVKAGDTE